MLPLKNHFSKSQKRIKEAGVVKFYYDRKVLAEDVGSIGDFINSARRNVTYVGCWLSSSLKQDLIEVMKDKAINGVKFVFCIHAPRTGAIREYASFFNSDEISVNTRIEDSILALYRAKCELPSEVSENIKIFWHTEMITTSFWLIDDETKNSKIQLDFKLVNSTSRWFSFGMEIIKASSGMFDNVRKSYLSVIEEKKLITEEYIDEIDGTRKKREEMRNKIIVDFPFDPSKPYVFISYSHKNSCTVYQDLYLLKQKINCWIDFEGLDGGRNRTENDWTQKIKPVLESPNCIGVVSYVSEKAFKSVGFIKECNWIKIHRPDFYCFLIDFSIDISPTIMLNKIRALELPGESSRDKQIRDEALTYITQATSEGKESYYRVELEHQHLNNTDFVNWLNKINAKTVDTVR